MIYVSKAFTGSSVRKSLLKAGDSVKATSSVATAVIQERDDGAFGRVWERERSVEAYGSETLLINRNDKTFDTHLDVKEQTLKLNYKGVALSNWITAVSFNEMEGQRKNTIL